jgi:uncharacterized protein YciI
MNAKGFIFSLCLLLVAGCAHAPVGDTANADNFWFIFLESGKKTPDDKALVGQMQKGHIDNFKRLFGEKKLFAAGPLQDPSGLKRGIVIARAPTKEVLATYFQPDEYVREGYMTLNAVTCEVHEALATSGIDANSIEEVRIIQIMRSAKPPSASDAKANHAFLHSLVIKGAAGAWYSIDNGPVAEILFSRTTDTKALQETFAQYPGAKSRGAEVVVWRQWLSKGVVR